MADPILSVDHLSHRVTGAGSVEPAGTAEGHHPGGDVGGLATCAQGDGCGRVVIGCQGSIGRDEDVEHDVTGHAHQH